MAAEDAFHIALSEAVKAYQVRSHKVGIAVAVSDSKCDVDVEGEPKLFDVRFHAIEDAVGSKIVIKPKEGSKVLVGIINNLVTEAFIEQCSEIDEVLIVTGDKEYKLNAEGHLIKGGNDTLKQVIQLIIEAVQKIMVLQGNNPDFLKLTQAQEKLNNILK